MYGESERFILVHGRCMVEKRKDCRGLPMQVSVLPVWENIQVPDQGARFLMPPRSTPPPKSLSYPLNDSATFRDLLLFEERLKTTAASLQKRKSRYQRAFTRHNLVLLAQANNLLPVFLVHLLLITLLLLTEILLPRESSLLLIPYRLLLLRFIPSTDPPQSLPPILPTTLLFVCVVTLILFFASGMYSEKIGYANKYVPHANRALRSFNMLLNVRKPSRFRNPLSFFFPRPKPPQPQSQPLGGKRNASVPIPPIPPASNPRGELIFSSRVDKNFRESYERHRNTFERKREERARLQRSMTLWGKLRFWDKPLLPPESPAPAHTRASTLRGRGSRSTTPPTRTGSPLSKGTSRPSTLGTSTSNRGGGSVSSDSE